MYGVAGVLAGNQADLGTQVGGAKPSCLAPLPSIESRFLPIFTEPCLEAVPCLSVERK